jgi:hypothetical protein
MGWTSPVNMKLNSTEESPLPEVITADQGAWIGSLLTLGAVFGKLRHTVTARHAKHSQFDMSANVLVLRSILSPKCKVWCVVDSTYYHTYALSPMG